MRELLPENYVCECGKKHKFTTYVYAHWDVEQIHTCDCGRENTLYRGKVINAIQDPKT